MQAPQSSPTPQTPPHTLVEVRAPRGARVLELVWSDGLTHQIAHRLLRAFCPCAHCQGHAGGITWVETTDALPEAGLDLTDLAEVGHYALGLRWADSHSTGIYAYAYLRTLGELAQCDEATQRNTTL